MQADNEIRKTTQPLPGRSNGRMAPRQTVPWGLLRELTAAIQDFNVNHPEDDVTSPVARPIEPR